MTPSNPGPEQGRIRLGVIGAGIMARTAYARDLNLPAMRERFQVLAVHSRTQASARSLAELLPDQPAVEETEAALLARADIEAVAIVLPIPLLAGAVERALLAGKHVLSEKPIAMDSASARALIARWQARAGHQEWMVAENWRYEEAFVRAAGLLHSGVLGEPVLAHWAIYSSLAPGSKYYDTPWRRSGGLPGGLLLDGGVHQIAVLRLLLGEIQSVSAAVSQSRADLPPCDTLAASLRFLNGAVATYARTFAVGTDWYSGLHIAAQKGSLRVDRGEIHVAFGAGAPERITTAQHTGGPAQLLAFAEAVRGKAPHRNTPQEALRDLVALEAMLRAADRGGTQPEDVALL